MSNLYDFIRPSKLLPTSLNLSRTKFCLNFLKPASSTPAPPNLLTIAGELRNRIYEYVLLEAPHVYPYDYSPCSCNCPKSRRVAPTVALLAVNKQINAEATPLLYANVTFNLGSGYSFMRFNSDLDHICMFSHPSSERVFHSRHLIRSVRFEFSPEHLPTGSHATRMLECWSDVEFQRMSIRQRAQSIHDYEKSLSDTVWQQACLSLLSMRGLEKLTLDVEQAFCPQGCCRRTGYLVGVLIGFKFRKVEIKVEGDIIRGEKKMILKGLKFDESASPFNCLDDGSENNSIEEGEDEENDEAVDEDDEDTNSNNDSDISSTSSDADADSDDDSDSSDMSPNPLDLLLSSSSSPAPSNASTISIPAEFFANPDATHPEYSLSPPTEPVTDDNAEIIETR